jgi:hypothetical protein
MFDSEALLDALEQELRAAIVTTVAEFVATARAQLEGAVAEVARERDEMFAEVAKERATALAEVEARRGELAREVKTMHKHNEAQEGRVELNIGGYRFQTSVQTLRRIPHTFFDAYFSGRHVQDVCDDGTIFVDRNGEHFGHVLEYMRDGYVSVADPGTRPSVSLLHALKREFGFYCIELVSEQLAEPQQLKVDLILRGVTPLWGNLATMERLDASSGEWRAVAAIDRLVQCRPCVMAGELYVVGGYGDFLLSVEKYTPSSDTWSAVSPMPYARSHHTAVAVGSAMYVLGGMVNSLSTASVLKFDSAQGTWSEIAPMPAASCNSDSASCVLGTDIYVFGGYSEELDENRDTVFKYDTVANEWSTLAPMPHACCVFNASVFDGLVYFVGACASGYDVLRFDPLSGVWSTTAPTEIDRDLLGTLYVLGGCLYAAGGEGSRSNNLVERYNVANNTWTTVADLLEGQQFFCAVTIGSAGPAEEQDLFDTLIAKASK